MLIPFVHTFSTPDANYVFDVNTNAIIKIEPDVYNYLNKIEKYQNLDQALDELKLELSSQEISKVINYFKEAERRGFFSTNRSKKILHPIDSLYADMITSNMQQLTLQVTQNCNLRCDYCAYSGKYNDRSHDNINMSEETAKKAIDFFMARTQDSPRITLGFYGGEPLLSFELIQKAVAYFEEKAWGKEYNFTLTTNGTLFNEENLRYFAAKNFDLLLSLDGPKHIHDKNRIFATGSGTFEKVIANLEMAENILPEFTKQKIQINAVLDPEANFCIVNDFFTNCESVKEIGLMGNMISTINRKEEVGFFDEAKTRLFYEELDYEAFKFYLAQSGRDISYSKIMDEWEFKDFTDVSERRILRRQLPETFHPSGPCVPGSLRLFVDVFGKFFPCERVCEAENVCCMGDMENGLDEEKGRSFLNIGSLTEEQCLNCWAAGFCMSCLDQSNDGKKLNSDSRLSWCKDVKGMTDEKLIKYCVVKELEIPIAKQWEVLEF